MSTRQQHQHEVSAFLQERLSIPDWKFSYPHGWGKESYFAKGGGKKYFVKVGVEVERYRAMAEIGVTPPVVLHGHLESGSSVLVQAFVTGRNPSRAHYRERMQDVARVIREMHFNPLSRVVLPAAPTETFREAGLRALERLRQKWEQAKAQVPSEAGFVDESLAHLAEHISQFAGEGLVASHGDICNANWLFSADGNIYLIDFDLMKMDDPAFDMGALLWWYYPPELRGSFLREAGYRYDDAFKSRMQIRMTMHCLDILLPREGSFDQFDPEDFGDSLRDFRAVLDGGENPEGYND